MDTVEQKHLCLRLCWCGNQKIRRRERGQSSRGMIHAQAFASHNRCSAHARLCLCSRPGEWSICGAMPASQRRCGSVWLRRRATARPSKLRNPGREVRRSMSRRPAAAHQQPSRRLRGWQNPGMSRAPDPDSLHAIGLHGVPHCARRRGPRTSFAVLRHVMARRTVRPESISALTAARCPAASTKATCGGHDAERMRATSPPSHPLHQTIHHALLAGPVELDRQLVAVDGGNFCRCRISGGRRGRHSFRSVRGGCMQGDQRNHMIPEVIGCRRIVPQFGQGTGKRKVAALFCLRFGIQ